MKNIILFNYNVILYYIKKLILTIILYLLQPLLKYFILTYISKSVYYIIFNLYIYFNLIWLKK